MDWDKNVRWNESEIDILDNYITGYTSLESLKELSEYLNKSESSVRLKISRRRREIGDILEKRKLSQSEYIYFLSNRFYKNIYQISDDLEIPSNFLLEELDSLDCLEAKESLMENYKKRPVSNDEYEIFLKLYVRKKKNKNYISHILNRPISKIEELIKEYESI